MPQARQNWIPWLLLGALCLSARTVASAQSAQTDPADSPSQRLDSPPPHLAPAPQRFVQVQTPQSGSLAGRLTNLHSAPLAGVSVVLRNQATGAESRTTTGKNGAFRFASLDAGEYTLEADAAQLGHGRLEEILVTGGAESRVQAAMNFEPAPPALLEAAAPTQIAGPHATPRPAPVASSPQLIASVSEKLIPEKPVLIRPDFDKPIPVRPVFDKPIPVRPVFDKPGLVWPHSDKPVPVWPDSDRRLGQVPLEAFATPDAVRPSAQPASPAPAPSQSLTQSILPSQVTPQVFVAPATPLNAPTQASAKSPAIVAPPTTTPPTSPTQSLTKSSIVPFPLPTIALPTPQRAQLEIHFPALPERAALETQSVPMQLALAAAPPRPFPLNTNSAPILAAAVPTGLLPAALLNLPAVAATVAAAQPSEPVTPAVSTTMNASQLQALPASGRRWQEFLLDAPAAGPSAGSSQASFRSSEESAEVAVDGANTRLAFGVTAGSATRGALGDDPDPQHSMNQSQSWSGGRGLGVSEAAIREVTTVAGNVEAEGMRSAGGRTSIRTESGSNEFHGQGSLFDRQNTWGARNPFTQWVTETAPATLAFNPSGPPLSVPVFDNGPSGSPESYTPPDHEIVWGVGMGSRIRRDKLFWFAALDSYHRNDPGLAMVKHPYLQRPCELPPCPATGFFATPSDAQLQLLSAQLDLPSANPVVEGLTAYSQMLETLSGLLGPAPRTTARWVGFARLDWQAAERHRFTLEGIGADSNAPGGGLSRVSESYGSHSFGSSEASKQWILARWEAYLTSNLLAVTQGSAGRAVLGAKPSAPSAFEQAFLGVNSWGQLPQIVVDSRYGFTIGNPSRFGQGSYPDERLYHGQEMLDWVHNHLLVKAGFEIDHDADAISLLRNQTGTYSYSKVGDFISDALVFQKFGLQDPSNYSVQQSCGATDTTLGSQPCYSYYSQTMGPTDWHLSTNDWAGYVTAQWQLSKLAVVSAGMRWEREELPPPIASLANPELPFTEKLPDLGNNWGPRVSLALGAARSHWPVLRFGYGMYYGRVENATIETALTQTGSPKGDLNFFMRPSDNCQHCAGGAPPFPHVFAGQPSSVVKPGVVGFAPSFHNPEIHQAIASIEETLPGQMELTASAMLSLGRRLPISADTNINTDLSGDLNSGSITYAVKDTTGRIKSPQITIPKFYASWPVSAGTCPYYLPQSGAILLGRLCPDYQQITQIMSRANSTYEAANVSLVRYGRRGLSFHAHYTYAHAMDWNPQEVTLGTASSALAPLDSKQDFDQEYGTSNLDVRHSAAVMAVLESPWKLHDFAGRLANGWMLSAIGQFHSGLPYSMRITGSIPARPETGPYPQFFGLGPSMNGSGGDNRIYGTGSDGTSYNFGRNSFRYPNTWKADLRLAKRFDLGDVRQLEVLAESFNLFNHQNVTEIETTGYYIDNGSSSELPALNLLTGLKPNTTAFGQPLNINATDFYRERQIEIGLRLRF
jgi:hypothetical protein